MASQGEALFKLVAPGERKPDALRGDSDLIQAHGLKNILHNVLGPNPKVEDYSKNAKTAKEFRK